MSMFSNMWKYFFGESCSRPTQNVDLDTNLLSNDSSNNPIDHPVIQRKVLFIDILDDEADHKEAIKVEKEEIKEEQEEIKVEPIVEQEVEHKEEIKEEQEEIKEESIVEQQEIKVEPIVEQPEEVIVESIVEKQDEIKVEPIVEQLEIKVEPIVEQEVEHKEEPIVEPIVEHQDLSLLPKTAAECAILNQNLPENWRPFPMSNILQ